MERVLVVFENSEAGRRVADLLESGGTAKCQVCRSGDQARRLLSRQTVYCVVCSPHLSDGPAEWLCPDLPPVCSLLLVGPQHTLDACASRDVFKLPTPIRREEAVRTVQLLLQFGHKTERLLRTTRTAAERELTDRAKALLMERKGLPEEEAHRLLQRRSMDSGLRLAQCAQQIIQELGA